MVLLWKIVVGAVACLGGIHASIKWNQETFDRFIMGIVRDIGRHKARNRRHQGSSKGLMVTLLHQDDPLEDLLLDAQEEDESDLPTYTRSELLEYGDGYDGRPILISIFGRVYDVSAGSKFYGPGSTYQAFAGHDVTYSLCTGCRTVECLERSADGLPENLLGEGKRWLSFFHLHDKYKLVGKLETDYFEIIMKELLEQDLLKTKDGQPLKAPIL